MAYIHITAIAMIFGLGYLLQSSRKKVQLGKNYLFWFLMALAILVRVVAARNCQGFLSDINCFTYWADRVYEVGPGEFYSTEIFTDYPPGYMYVLYLIGAINSVLKLTFLSKGQLLLIKLPAIICDLLSGAVIYKVAKKKLTPNTAAFLSALYLLNPSVILNSSLWGQVDSVFALFAALMCLAVMERKMFRAYFLFAIGMLVKPQMVMLTPVLLIAILDHVFLKDFSWKKLGIQIGGGLSAIVTALLACAPFGITTVIRQYTDTLSSYPYVSVNAYNFWTMFGLNYTSQDATLCGVTYQSIGTGVIVLIVILSVMLFFKLKEHIANSFLIGAFIISTMFTFSVRMHERYLFPVMLLLILAYVLQPIRQIGYCIIAFSVVTFYNAAYVLFVYDNVDYYKNPMIIGISILTVCVYVYFASVLIRLCKGTIKVLKPEEAHTGAIYRKWEKQRYQSIAETDGKNPLAWTRMDTLIVLAITAVYAAIALYDLGDMDVPDSQYTIEEGESVQLDFAGAVELNELHYYLGNLENRIVQIDILKEGDVVWTPVDLSTFSSVFAWGSTSIGSEGVSLRLTVQNKTVLEELVLLDNAGNQILPENASEYAALFDEQELYPEQSSFRDSTYFDEIYHARTAYEYIHGEQTYETTHPPLGKIFISLGVRIFGMNPFGWRIAGTLFGVFMVPLVYAFAHRFMRSRWLAALVCLIFTFDFMHFAQTRIATIDVYVTFFIILMYYFMYRYAQTNWNRGPVHKSWLVLGACGVAMGLGIASKWTGIYAGAGLAVIFFAVLYHRYCESKTENSLEQYRKKTIQTIGFCIIFFVVIPCVIYLLSYIPFVDGTQRGLLARLIHNQDYMFNYHSGLVDTHPFSSWWYQWPVMSRPIWYYGGIVSDTLRESINSFGNPAVWWAGIPAFLYVLYLAVIKKDGKAQFLCVGYLAQYLPWFLVTRIVFIYHYFPSVFFVTMMIGYSLFNMKKRMKSRSFYLVTGVYVLLVIGLFALFYPILSGQPVSTAYIDRFLRWFDSWVLAYQ